MSNSSHISVSPTGAVHHGEIKASAETTNEVTLDELKDSFNIDISWPKTLSWVKVFNLTNLSGAKFSGRLYWDSNDGYSIYWDNDLAPEMADRPEFEYMLDSYASDPWYVPPIGDMSDAGMDGA